MQDAVLSQGGLRDAPYILLLCKFPGVPDYAHGNYYLNF